ncbi:MAG: hypothetical protein ACUVTB_03245 [Candidatus Bathycorpusculaceae bacterium]
MAKYNLKTIHWQVLLTTFIFCAISGFYETLAPTLPLFLQDLDYTAVEIGFISYILSMIVFILDSAFLFVILYSICRRNFMENIANTIISLITGTIVGYWIGGLSGLLMSPPRFPTSPSIFTISILLSEFGACSAAYLNIKWNHLTSKAGMTSERPFGVVLISALYAVLSLLSPILALMLWGLSSIGLEVLFNKILLFTSLITLLSVLAVAYLFIAHGFYRGRRWAWFTVFRLHLNGHAPIHQPVNSRILLGHTLYTQNSNAFN